MRGFLHCSALLGKSYSLARRRLPAQRSALEYVKAIEPPCPRLSLGGRAQDPAKGWEEHLHWLYDSGLSSAAEGVTPIPG